MRNSTVLIVVAAATAVVAAPAITPATTSASAPAATRSPLFPSGFTISVPDNDEEKDKTTAGWTLTNDNYEADLAGWRKQQEAEDYEEEYKRALEKRDAARKHGVVCTIL